MANSYNSLLGAVKDFIGYTHTDRDALLDDTIGECLADLQRIGIVNTAETDPNIRAAVKLYCAAALLDDNVLSEKFQARYESLKSSLTHSSAHIEPPEGGTGDA